MKRLRLLIRLLILLVSASATNGYLPTAVSSPPRRQRLPFLCSTAGTTDTDQLAQQLNDALEPCQKDLFKTCNVQVAPVSTHRLGLVATRPIKKGDLVLNSPFDDRTQLTAALATDLVYKDVLSDDYQGWTADKGLMALLLLNELARTAGQGTDQPTRPAPLQSFMETWMASLPTPDQLQHPLLWSEADQEVLQQSSTTKIYRWLDDIEDDGTWWQEQVWKHDKQRFPETVTLNGQTRPCFNLQGFTWALALVSSRSFFVQGALRLIPLLDMVNHDDSSDVEVETGYMGTFGTTQGAQLVAFKNYKAGDEVTCSYGPKSAADYLLEHGFCPDQCWKQAVSQLTFEIDPDDRFRDDKLDILEYETYTDEAMDPVQTFDLVAAPGRDGQPDPAMMQFVRLVQLGSTDAFLLESIFRKDVWGFMDMPVSEANEGDVIEAIAQACEAALQDLQSCPQGGPEVCTKLRESEIKALTQTLEYVKREQEALDLKEYYQERRLKDLGLDSEWSPEDDLMGREDLGFGQTRTPGGADYDW